MLRLPVPVGPRILALEPWSLGAFWSPSQAFLRQRTAGRSQDSQLGPQSGVRYSAGCPQCNKASAATALRQIYPRMASQGAPQVGVIIA